MSKSRDLLTGSALALALMAAPAMAEKLGLGRAALPEEIAAWDVAVLPDGTGLPEGSGDVATGDEVFAEKCAACHGDFAEGLDSWPVLAGGIGSLQDPRPVKTIGSYWPYLSTVFDYVHRSMPFGAAQTVSNDEAYAIAAFLLYSNGLVEDDFVLSKETFGDIKMPNADGFIVDDRADTEYTLFRTEPCMENCRDTAPEVTKRAININVTPKDDAGRPLNTIPPLTLAEAAPAPTATEAAPAEATAEAAPAEAAPAEAAPAEAAATPAAADADPALVEAGATVFKKCAACHKVGEGAKNGTGPMLNGIVGRAAGTVEGYRYSKPMQDAGAGGMVWDAANLRSYLADPKGFIPKNKMSFAGLKKDEDLDAVIAYLATFGG
jgi:cytochrome c